MKQLSPNLYGVIVPKKAQDFRVETLFNVNKLCYDPDRGNDFAETVRIDLDDNFFYEILGTASEKEITFDCEPFVKNIKWTNNGEFYETEEPSEKLNEDWYKNESFLSLIKSKGIELKPNEKLLVLKKH